VAIPFLLQFLLCKPGGSSLCGDPASVQGTLFFSQLSLIVFFSIQDLTLRKFFLTIFLFRIVVVAVLLFLPPGDLHFLRKA